MRARDLIEKMLKIRKHILQFFLNKSFQVGGISLESCKAVGDLAQDHRALKEANSFQVSVGRLTSSGLVATVTPSFCCGLSPHTCLSFHSFVAAKAEHMPCWTSLAHKQGRYFEYLSFLVRDRLLFLN